MLAPCWALHASLLAEPGVGTGAAFVRLRAGTSGYSDKAWKGSFYPERLPDRETLGYYAARA